MRLESILEELDQLQYTKDQLNKLVSDMENCETKITSTNKYIAKESTRFRELMGTICPLCGSPVGE